MKNNSIKECWQHKIISSFCCFIFMYFPLSILAHSGQTPQEQEHDPIVEKVTVTNVEVPVRVLYKGKPVTNLTKEDFIIYENRKKMEINGFFIKRKKIKVSPSPGTTTPTGQEVSLPPLPRMFVLAFNVTQYNKYFQEAVDHLFDNLLKPTDHVIVFTNNTTRQYLRLENMPRVKQEIIRDLKEASKDARQRLLSFTNRVETFLQSSNPREDIRLFLEPGGTSRIGEMAKFAIRMLKRYQEAWNEYKKRYLTPRAEHFYYFARYLEKVKGEKYVLNFYQFEFFPQVRVNSRTMLKMRTLSTMLSNTNNAALVANGRLINNMLNQLNKDYDLERGFPNEEITKLFSKVDTTFHSFFIKATNPTTLQDLGYRVVASDLENVLKSITDMTGGKNITSNKLVASLEIIAEIEDVYYILTYAPQNPNVAGKLNIKVKDKKYKVFYDDNFRADYINEYLQKLEEKIKTPEIKLKTFSFDRKILAFTVTEYLMKKIKEQDKEPVGMLKIRIRLVNRDNISLFDQEKVLTAQKNEMKISLGAFKKIKRGEYDFLIDALDMLTGKEDNFHQKVKVR
ncbi:MAG: hypothetical protein PVH61_21425 [Candidatus Aminicenantes bacterium]